MSAYINRLIQRLLPTGEPVVGNPGGLLNPFVRSQSPIAAIDQRLAVDEQLGHGFGGLEPTNLEPQEAMVAAAPAAQPTRIQRKAMGTIEAPKPPTASFAPLDNAPQATEPTKSAALPLDPGPLFDLAPRYFDEPAAPRYFDEPPAPAPMVSIVPTSRVQPTSSAETQSADAMTPRFMPSSDRARVPTPPSEARFGLGSVIAPKLEPRFASPDAKADIQPPWRRQTFETTSAASAAAAPQFVPSPQGPIEVPARAPAVQLYIVPRPRMHEPLIHEPVERAYVQAPAPSTQRASSPERQSSKPTPTPVAQAPRRSPGGKLTIDSISQIGPLDRHFPNRRSFRLRYR
jgi:hypothetical protein